MESTSFLYILTFMYPGTQMTKDPLQSMSQVYIWSEKIIPRQIVTEFWKITLMGAFYTLNN